MSYTNPTTEEITLRREQLAPFDSTNEKVALALFTCILMEKDYYPRSYLDLGSGTGSMVNMARKLDIDAYGVDVINGPEDWFIDHDLNIPIQLVSSGDTIKDGIEDYRNSRAIFDLITCIEVAEHLEPESSAVLAETIDRHLEHGGRLVFSSAPFGQGGEHHINNQHPWYWRSLFHKHGISYRQDLTMQLSHIWSWIAGPMMWLGSNVQVYDK